MDLDRSLRDSTPPTPPITAAVEHEIHALAEVHAEARGRQGGGLMTRFRSRNAAVVGGLAILLLGGTSVATAGPALLEFFQPLPVDWTSVHTFAAAPDAPACAIEWTVTSADGSGHGGEDNPTVIAAREYLLSLDLATVEPDPVLIEGNRNGVGREGPPASERELHSVALMGTVAKMIFAEVERQGLDDPVFLHTTGCE